jgi:hypothetical protein
MTDYAEQDVPNNFGTLPTDVEVGAELVVHVANPRTSGGSGIVYDRGK